MGADGKIYLGCDDNHIYALNPDGTLHWSYATGADVASSPAIATGVIYVGSDDHHLYAIGAPR